MENKKIKAKKLFEPGRIRHTWLKNRVVASPVTTNYATAKGAVTDRITDHYEEKARGGAALIVVEGTYIAPEGKSFLNQLGIYDNKLIPGLAKLVRAIKRQDAKASIQLQHAGRRTSSIITGVQPVAPSSILCAPGAEVPRELTLEDINRLTVRHAEAAKRAKEAGFDAIQLHGAHGYLLSSFLSPLANKRVDIYGGDLDARTRFIVEVIKAIREEVGKEFPVTIKLSGDEFIEGGISIEDTKIIAPKLVEAGIDAIMVSAGTAAIGKHITDLDNPHTFLRNLPMGTKPGCLVYLAEAVKKAVGIPVIAVGKINDPFLAEGIISEGRADFVALGRALLADPEFPRKTAEGRFDEIRQCVACQECFNRLSRQLDMVCAVNPMVGREKGFKIRPTIYRKKVLVIGGGPSGMEAARVAAMRGCSVTLYEKSGKLGGQLKLACVPPHRGEIRKLLDYLTNQMKKLQVKIETGREGTPDLVRKLEPDALIIATGSTPIVPKIPGITRNRVVTAEEVLRRDIKTGERVIVIGGGLVGCETADFLAYQGKNVTIIEMLHSVANDTDTETRTFILSKLNQKDAKIVVGARAKRIIDEGVVIDRGGKEEMIKGNTVILALGTMPRRNLIEAFPVKNQELSLKDRSIQVYLIGDVVEPRKIMNAMYEGAMVAHHL